MAQLSGSVGRIVQVIREQLPALLDRMSVRVREEVPFYAAEDVVDGAELRAFLAANVEYVLGGLLGLLGGDVSDVAAPMATGHARATQGAPLVEMLAAYRLGFAELWVAFVDVARTLPEVTDAALVELAGEMFQLHSAYADASVSGYRDEYREILCTTECEHSVLVEAVLAGSTSKGALWEVAQALRLPLEGHFLVVAAERSSWAMTRYRGWSRPWPHSTSAQSGASSRSNRPGYSPCDARLRYQACWTR
ncbi:MAG: hypothetical protein JO100_15360 [Pseudonocardia sp.]|nr:hypothetical protein [Pseudonocardia sp.]